MGESRAPIVLFVFNRLDHVQRAVRSLQGNALAAESELYIYSDGARNAGEAERVEQVRAYCRGISGFADLKLIERGENLGIERNEVEALTELFGRYGECIILEDDLEVGTRFLEYMNLALERYREEKKVISVSGYSYIEASERRTGGQQFYFSQLTTSWGWATWADRWALYDDDDLNLEVLATREQQWRFDVDGAHGFYQMLTEQMKNHYITWDVAWYLKAFELGMLTLTPVYSLVNNIGMDGSGIHYNNEAINSNRVRDLERIGAFCFPERVCLDERMRRLEVAGMKKQERRERRNRRVWKVRTVMRRMLGRAEHE